MNRLETAERLHQIYHALLKQFGPQHWWPGESPFEVCVGAILTQNTNWQNVAKAIANIKAAGCLNPQALLALDDAALAQLIRPSGYFNIKTKRLKQFLRFLVEDYGGDVRALAQVPVAVLREKLLAVKGIGCETADSIILYACELPSFVVDAYTYRIFLRHEMIEETADYHEIQDLFHRHLEKEVPLYNEYHALLVRLGKEFCLKSKPRCEHCPLYFFLPPRSPLRTP